MLTSKQVYNAKLLRKVQLDMIVSGLSRRARKKLWRQKCQIHKLKQNDSKNYEYYCNTPTACDHEIDKDITRTFTQNHQFCGDISNYKKLQRILHAFAAKHPEVGYIQGLNFVAGNLLLLFPEEVINIILDHHTSSYATTTIIVRLLGIRKFVRDL